MRKPVAPLSQGLCPLVAQRPAVLRLCSADHLLSKVLRKGPLLCQEDSLTPPPSVWGFLKFEFYDLEFLSRSLKSQISHVDLND